MGRINPTISVIVSAHNRPEYLMEALKSLRGQTAPPDTFEIIVVKDYALDLTGLNIGCLNIKFIDVSQTDLVYKHIAGIKTARGSFIAFMDDDDLFASIKIERILYLSKYMDGDSFCFNEKKFFNNYLDDLSALSSVSISTFEVLETPEFGSRKLNHHTPWYNLSSMIIGKDLAVKGMEIIGNFRREIDLLWYLIALEYGSKIIYDSSYLTFYRRHSGGVSRSDSNEKICKYAEQALENYERMALIFKKKITCDTIEVMRAEWRAKASIVGCNLHDNNFWNTEAILVKSLKNHSVKDVLKILMLFLISRVSTKISSNLYPKFYV